MLPKQILGPSPNGRYVNCVILVFPLNLSGLNCRGSGKCSASRCRPMVGMITGVPFSSTTSVPGI